MCMCSDHAHVNEITSGASNGRKWQEINAYKINGFLFDIVKFNNGAVEVAHQSLPLEDSPWWETNTLTTNSGLLKC